MYDRLNEDVAFQRVVDLQREMENSRLMAASGSALAVRSFSALARLAKWLGGLLFEPDPRARVEESEVSSDVA